MNSDPAPPQKRRRLERVTAACDLCKQRKVKCDGEQPCGYCQRKHLADGCTFTAPKIRGQARSAGNTPNNPEQRPGNSTQRVSPDRARSEGLSRRPRNSEEITGIGASLSPTVSRDDHPEDTAVPLEGRILCDAQGKVIFIGDCAPLSFLQTVRHLIASEVDAEGLPMHASRDSMIEVARSEPTDQYQYLAVAPHEVQSLVEAYAVVTSGLVHLFEQEELLVDMETWASGHTPRSSDAATAVFFLVLAIGAQEKDESKANAWFNHARDILTTHLCASMNVSTVQGFALVAIFMLRAFQPNGAYLYFSLAARTAYAIGLHRTEVNASLGEPIRTMRDRIWKSLRVVDQLISNLLGRPPSTSNVDCTVKYNITDMNSDLTFHMLDASVQIFMIIERVVVEVYSRKRISLRIASYVSHQLKNWASNWLQLLSNATARSHLGSSSREEAVGACSTLCSYFYGIMLLTRPFLIYELYEYLGASLKGGGTQGEHQEKRKYADAALEAAASFVETLQTVIQTGKMPLRMPLIVSWLFTTSLVLAVGVLGRSGLEFEDDCRASIRCLDYFGKVDPHAQQYSVIVQALLKTTITHAKKRELHLRSQRKQASSSLFGLLPSHPESRPRELENIRSLSIVEPFTSTAPEQDNTSARAPPEWAIFDADFFALPWPSENDQGLQDFLQPGTHTLDGASIADIPLFPMYNQHMGGGFL